MKYLVKSYVPTTVLEPDSKGNYRNLSKMNWHLIKDNLSWDEAKELKRQSKLYSIFPMIEMKDEFKVGKPPKAKKIKKPYRHH